MLGRPRQRVATDAGLSGSTDPSQAQVDALQVQILGGGDCAGQPVPSRQLGPASGSSHCQQAQKVEVGEGTRGEVRRFTGPHPGLQPSVFIRDLKNLSHLL